MYDYGLFISQHPPQRLLPILGVYALLGLLAVSGVYALIKKGMDERYEAKTESRSR